MRLIFLKKRLIFKLHFYQRFFLGHKNLQVVFEALKFLLKFIDKKLVLFLQLIIQVKIMALLMLLNFILELLQVVLKSFVFPTFQLCKIKDLLKAFKRVKQLKLRKLSGNLDTQVLFFDHLLLLINLLDKALIANAF